MHSKQQADTREGGILAPLEVGARIEPPGEPFEGPLKAEEKSTSVEGRLTGEHDASSKASKKEGDERTKEWWEGYDPGMDVSF
jgi:hypothetical protein